MKIEAYEIEYSCSPGGVDAWEVHDQSDPRQSRLLATLDTAEQVRAQYPDATLHTLADHAGQGE